MSDFVILPDVTCDLSKEIRDYFGLEDYIPSHVHINDDSYSTTLDWDVLDKNKFYKLLSDKKNQISSSTASPEEYYRIFKKYAEQGRDILSMSISSQISGTYNVASLAAKQIKEEYPNVKIICFDSLRMSGSFGLLVCYACELRRSGLSIDETVDWLEANKNKVHQMGPIDDLTFVARRGQISEGKAFMGNLVGIKPMGDSNSVGYVSVLAKVKGIKKALDVTVSYVKHMSCDIENQYVFIMHSNRDEYAEILKNKLSEKITCKGIFVSDVFSGCGTNIGPGMISVYFMGEPISENNQKEKDVLNLSIEENTK